MQLHYTLALNLNENSKKLIPKSLDDILNLSWLYTDLEPFSKPSPDQLIDHQKSHGKRVPIIAKTSLKAPQSCGLLKASPIYKPKPEPKLELPNVYKAS
jgi:hypothetical protein